MKLVSGKLGLVLAVLSTPAFAGSSLDVPGFNLNFNTIIGGTDVQVGDLVQKSTVLVVGKDGNSTFICTGSLIDKDIVLTAAHCLGTDGKAPVVAVFKTSIQNVQKGDVVQAKDRRRMSDFLDRAGHQDADWHDLALIKLASPIPASYSPVKFLSDKSLLQTGGTVTISGYGITSPVADPTGNAEQGAGVLRKVDVSVMDAKYGDTEMLVSLTNNKGACHGDSGGPAFVSQGNQLFLVGVASRLTDKDRVANNGDVADFSCSVEMVYTNALALQDWIQTNIKSLHGIK